MSKLLQPPTCLGRWFGMVWLFFGGRWLELINILKDSGKMGKMGKMGKVLDAWPRCFAQTSKEIVGLYKSFVFTLIMYKG